MKKVLALFLTFCFLFSLVSVTGYAANDSEVKIQSATIDVYEVDLVDGQGNPYKEIKVKVVGYISSGEGKYVTIQVKDSGDELDYIGQTISKVNGEFEFVFTPASTKRDVDFTVQLGAQGMNPVKITFPMTVGSHTEYTAPGTGNGGGTGGGGGGGGGGSTKPQDPKPEEPKTEEPKTEEPKTEEPADNVKKFIDLDNYPWAKEQIEFMASKGIIRGTSENTYSPGNNITRADFMVLLVRTLGLTAEFEDNFSDVKEGTYYYNELGIARALGIAKGSGDNKFNPEQFITRQDMMVLVERTLKQTNKMTTEGTAEDLKGFSDASKVAEYAVNGVAALVKDGIIQGSGSEINPLGTATRAEVAVIIYRIYHKYLQVQ